MVLDEMKTGYMEADDGSAELKKSYRHVQIIGLKQARQIGRIVFIGPAMPTYRTRKFGQDARHIVRYARGSGG